MDTSPLLVLGVLTSFLFILLTKWKYRYPLPLPPGPRGWPLLGSFFEMPDSFEWLHWAKFKDLYGSVSSVTVLGKRVIILNTLKGCVDILEKKSSVSSGRPRMPFAGELVGWDQQLLLVPYNRHFRAMRKLAQGLTGTKAAAASYVFVQETEAKHLVSRIHEKPTQLVKHLQTTIGAILLRMSHGYITQTDGKDPLVNLIETAAKDFYEATKPGKWFVDIFPFLKYIPSWFPGAGFKKTAAQYQKVNMDQTDLPFQFVIKAMEERTALPSFVKHALESESLNDDERYALKFCAAAMYGGGLDTMTGWTSTFFLMMIIHPEIQRRAQEELDAVIGPHRLPTVRDRVDLPYLRAIQKEIYRWAAIVPLGIPHCATDDIVYESYFIPKDSLLVNNIWQIAHDPENYVDPMTFNPDRFLDSQALDPDTFVFGFGRRKCPGIEVAHSTIFIIIATCLAVFEFGHPQGVDGKEEKLREEFVSGSVIHPKPFGYTVKPRSGDASALINEVNNELPMATRVPSSL